MFKVALVTLGYSTMVTTVLKYGYHLFKHSDEVEEYSNLARWSIYGMIALAAALL